MERVDDLMRGGFRLIQDPDKYCFSIDSVLLADFAQIRRGEHAADLCSGSGVIPLLMLARYPGTTYTALEIQPDMVDMARRSMALNGVSGRIGVIQADIRDVPSLPGRGRYDVVTANPPYMDQGAGRKLNEMEQIACARHEVSCDLRQVMEAAAALLKFHGRFYLVHRASRLPDILVEMRRVGLEPKKMRLVYPFRDKDASQVLLAATLHGGAQLTVLPPLVTYESPGVYTRQMQEVYGADGQPSCL